MLPLHLIDHLQDDVRNVCACVTKAMVAFVSPIGDEKKRTVMTILLLAMLLNDDGDDDGDAGDDI